MRGTIPTLRPTWRLGLLLWALLILLALVNWLRADEPAIQVTSIRIDVSGARGATRPTLIHTKAYQSGAGVWEKWSTETNRVFTNILFLPGRASAAAAPQLEAEPQLSPTWLVFAARNGRPWHFVRTAPAGLFQFRYARGVSPPVLQFLFIKRNEN